MRYAVAANLLFWIFASVAGFYEKHLQFSVLEGSPIGTFVGNVPNDQFNLHFRQRGNSKYVNYNETTGIIRSSVVIDREELTNSNASFNLILFAQPAAIISIDIIVLDVNDNDPNYTVAESATIGTIINLHPAKDADAGNNGTIVDYFLENDEKKFKLNKILNDKNGVDIVQLELVENIDREKKDFYVLRIAAKDGGEPARIGHATIFLNILDINDNAPLFTQKNYTFECRLPVKVEQVIGTVLATDADLYENAEKEYINCSELQCTDGCHKVCSLIIEAEDGGKPKLSTRALVQIKLLEINNHRPQISVKSFPANGNFVSVSNKAPVGSTVLVVTAKDGDIGQKAILQLIEGNSEKFFRFETSENFGVLRLNRAIENVQNPIKLTFLATDNGTPAKNSTRVIEVYVLDDDGEAPILRTERINVEVSRKSPKNWYVSTVELKNTSMSYNFGIISGIISTAQDLNNVSTDNVNLFISVTNAKPSRKVTKCQVNIRITSEFDNQLKFEKRFYKFEVNENDPALTLIGTVNAKYQDVMNNQQLLYTLQNEKAFPAFFIKERSGELMLRNPLDYEKDQQFILEVAVYDKRNPMKMDEAWVIVKVKDLNDNSPVFTLTDFYTSIERNIMPQAAIGQISAYDNDAGLYGKISYMILEPTSGLIEVEENTGTVLTTSAMHSYVGNSIKAIIGAKDGGGRMSINNATFNIQLLESVDKVPNFLNYSWTIKVKENLPIKTAIGVYRAVGVGPIQYSLSKTNWLTIDPRSGEIFTAVEFNRENVAEFPFAIFAFGSQGTAMKKGMIVVEDENDNAPQFEAGNSTVIKFDPDNGIGSELVKIVAKDDDEGYLLLFMHYFVSSNNKTQCKTDGILRYQKLLDEQDQIQFIVTARDNGNPPKESYLHVTVIINRKPTVPIFPSSLIYNIPENVAPGYKIASLMPNATSFFIKFRSKLPSSTHYPIELLSSGELVVQEAVTTDAIVLPADVTIDTYERTTSQSIVITVFIMDVNNNPPECPNNSTFYVNENQEPMTKVGVFTGIDKDESINSILEYELLEDKKTFSIHRHYGVVISDKSGTATVCEAKIYVIDENDNPPMFEKKFFHFYASLHNDSVGTVVAYDRDSNANARIRYFFKQKQTLFQINEETGNIIHTRKLQPNYMYNLNVIATNPSEPTMYDEAFVFIRTEDSDECKPKFSSRSSSHLEVSEDCTVGQIVGKVTASACQQPVTYSVSAEQNWSNSFAVDPVEGSITLIQPLDYEKVNSHLLVINASTAYVSELYTVTISVIDVNDNDPIVTTDSIHIRENNAPQTFCGVIATFDADSGENGEVEVEIEHIVPSYNIFRINHDNLFCVESLNRENISSYKIFLKAHDFGKPERVTHKAVTVIVDDENDNAPECKGGDAILVGNETKIFELDCIDADLQLNGTVTVELQNAPQGITLSNEKMLKIEPFVRAKEFTVTAFDNPESNSIYPSKSDAIRQNAKYKYTIIHQRLSSDIVFERFDGDLIISEEMLLGDIVGQVKVRSLLPAEFFLTDFKNSKGLAVSWIKIDKQSGEIRLKNFPDDVYAQIEVTVIAGQYTATKQFKIQVKNHATVFGDIEDFYNFSLFENLPTGSVIGTIGNSNVIHSERIYSILSSDSNTILEIDRNTGVISTKAAIDYEEQPLIFLKIAALDVKSRLRKTVLVQLNVVDVNDNAPMFADPEIILTVRENAKYGTLIGGLCAIIRDSNTVTYSMINAPSFIRLDSNAGLLTVAGEIDREQRSFYLFQVQTVDNDGFSGNCTVRLFIGDDNDNLPQFKQQVYHVKVPEDVPPGQVLVHFDVDDQDSDSDFWYEIDVAGNEMHLFEVSNDGNVIVANSLDREVTETHSLRVIAYDNRPPKKVHFTTCTVKVQVTDVNDNAPKFITPSKMFVNEETSVGEVVGAVKAVDADAGLNGVVQYRILPETHPTGLFIINPISGELKVNGRLDREKEAEYNFTIRAIDLGTPPLYSERNITVVLVDIDDNEPIFQSIYKAKVQEDLPVGHEVLQITFEDFDEESNKISIFEIEDDEVSSIFNVQQSGLIITKQSLDAERKKLYQFNVTARQSLNSKKRFIPIQIEVTDINDEAPKFLFGNSALFTMYNEYSGEYPVKIGRLPAKDNDVAQNNTFAYTIISGDLKLFNVNDRSGELYINYLPHIAKESFYDLNVQVTDLNSPQLDSEAVVTVNFKNAGCNTLYSALPIYKAHLQENMPPKSRCCKYSYRYFLLEENEVPFEVDSNTGWIRTKMPLDREEQKLWQLHVIIEDQNVPKQLMQNAVQITVGDENDNMPIFLNNTTNIYVPNTIKNGDIITVFGAYDFDDNDTLSYGISGEDSNEMSVDNSGVIRVVGSLTQTEYEIHITVTDSFNNISAVLYIHMVSVEEFPIFNTVTKKNVYVDENVENYLITSVSASSLKHSSDIIHYNLCNSKDFSINAKTGEIFTLGTQDHERNNKYQLVVSAFAYHSPQYITYAELTVIVNDINDNKPVFQKDLYKAQILENAEKGLFVTRVEAYDLDFGNNGKLEYRIVGSEMHEFFMINSKTGEIFTKTVFDAEAEDIYRFAVDILDENDNAPKFLRLFQANVHENAAVETSVIQIDSFDLDKTSNITYGLESNANGTFRIDPFSGEIILMSELDREKVSSYVLKVTATDGLYQVSTSVPIKVLDVNDNKPVFSRNTYSFVIKAKMDIGSFIGSVNATDDDDGENARIFYFIKCPHDFLYIDPCNGTISLARAINFYTNETFHCKVKASDNGILKQISEISVAFLVLNEEITPPRLKSGFVHVLLPRNLTHNTCVGHLKAISDPRFKVSYKLQENGEFIVSENGSMFSKTSTLARKTDTVRTLEVALSYEELPYISSLQNISLKLMESVLVESQMTKGKYYFQITENSPLKTKVGDIFLEKKSLSDDKSTAFCELISKRHVPFNISNRGEILVAGELDYEQERKYDFNITILYNTSSIPSYKVSVVVEIIDENDNVPFFPMEFLKFYVYENTAVGEGIGTVSAVDLDSGANAEIVYKFSSYSLLPFGINSTTGLIFVSAKVDYEFSSEYRVEVQAMNPDCKEYSTLTVEISVLSEDEYQPKFVTTEYNFEISSKAAKGTIIGKIEAVDRDDGIHGRILYVTDSNDLVTISSTGEVSVGSQFAKIRTTETLEVFAHGLQIFTAKQFAPAKCTVTIRLVDCVPTPVLDPSYNFQLNENFSTSHKFVLFDTPLPSDSSLRISSGLNNEKIPFCGERDGTLRICGHIDRQLKDFYSFQVFLLQGFTVRSHAWIHISVVGKNDDSVGFGLVPNIGFIRENNPAGLDILQLYPFARNSALALPSQQFTFQIADREFSKIFAINSSSGIVTSRVAFDREICSQYVVPILITDKLAPAKSAIQAIRIHVDDIVEHPPEFGKRLITIEATEAVSDYFTVLLHPLCQDTISNYVCYNLSASDDTFLSLSEGCLLRIPANVKNSTSFSMSFSTQYFASVNNLFSITRYKYMENLTRSSVLVVVWGAERDVGDAIDVFQHVVSDMVVRVVGVKQTFYDEYRLLFVVFDRNKNILLNTDTAEMLVHFFTKRKEFLNIHVVDIIPNYCLYKNPCKNNALCEQKYLFDGTLQQLSSLNTIRLIPVMSRTTTCKCAELTYGEYCQHKVENCSRDGICYKDGVCDRRTGLCTCRKGYSGPDCQNDIDECLAKDLCNNGVCINLPGSYKCVCDDGYYGDHCDKLKCNSMTCSRTMSIGFTTMSYMEIIVHEPVREVEFQFRTSTPNGLLLYSYSSKLENDFMALDVFEGELRFAYSNVIYGYSSFIFKNRIDDGQWKKVYMKSEKKTILVSVLECDESGNCDSCDHSDCRQSFPLMTKNIPFFNERVLVGGIKAYDDIIKRPGQVVAVDFIGCMRMIEFDGVEVNRLNALSHNLITGCPSNTYNCSNANVFDECKGGKCVDDVMGAVCICDNSFEAASCLRALDEWCLDKGEIRFELNEHFSRQRRLIPALPTVVTNNVTRQKRAALRDIPCEEVEYKGNERLGGIATQWMELDFKTKDENGQIFSVMETIKSISIKLENGHLKLISASKGANPIIVGLEDYVSDGKWHRLSVEISRNRRIVRFKCDNRGKDIYATEDFPQFNSDRVKYIVVGLEAFMNKFLICIRRFIVNNQGHNFEKTSFSVHSRQLFDIVRVVGATKGCQEFVSSNTVSRFLTLWKLLTDGTHKPTLFDIERAYSLATRSEDSDRISVQLPDYGSNSITSSHDHHLRNRYKQHSSTGIMDTTFQRGEISSIFRTSRI
uniref:CA domain-containing protein n=1 Tax=Syphacia muris TaxID=451379 RepID=A0A158R4V8_9BILA